jgi:glutamate dehydrogenase (NAD(P)+)
MNDGEKQTKPAPIIHEFIDDTVGLHAYIVIDSLCNNTSCGGVRISEDLSLEEIKVLAQAMTKKYCFLKQQMGGAKAGINLPKQCSPEQRTKILEAFGQNASALLRKKTYIPWTDLNSSPEDIATLMNAAGCDFQGISDSSFFTALTVASAVKAACETKAMDFSKVSVIIEGFGEVGMNLASELDKIGVKIVGVSTINGALYDANGLDIKKLIELKKQYQDDFVQQYTTEQIIQKELLLEMNTDILIPCARTWSINKTNMKNIKAKIIIPAANVPLTKEAETYLHQKGILCVPDFICNLGGVFGTSLYDNRNSIPRIHCFIMDEYGQLIKDLLSTSMKKHCLPSEIAQGIAEKNCKIHNQRTQHNSWTKKFSITVFNKSIHFLGVFPGLQPRIALQRHRKIFYENRRYMENHCEIHNVLL